MSSYGAFGGPCVHNPLGEVQEALPGRSSSTGSATCSIFTTSVVLWPQDQLAEDRKFWIVPIPRTQAVPPLPAPTGLEVGRPRLDSSVTYRHVFYEIEPTGQAW